MFDETNSKLKECKEDFDSLMSQIALVLNDEEYEDFSRWVKTESGWM